ncbi:hypothetical protein M413DRAFT_72823 [Hebeloma cylindrosporum]|uniref:Enoyl reductase (ER) domain-containing protein n=1 Tax=Hebeloma cylindrosporum TaxID=76867 RepID=A0A0C3BVQ2_HEBCY|nr:hypothetical protein M413DRAFT_72823 [Hebeloma cylindrosporum h7]
MTSEPKQKALLIEKKLGEFVVGEIDIWKPPPGQLLLRVQAVSLNPVDWKLQKRGVDEVPTILGRDFAGDVVEVGEGVTDFQKGDRVFVQAADVGAYAAFQQYALTLSATTAKIPPGFSYDQVATLPLALSTAYVGLYNNTPHGFGISPPGPGISADNAGTPILVLGGGSSVARLGNYLSYRNSVIQLAKLSGFSPIITTASLKHTDFLKSLGATHVFDRNLGSTELAAEINKVTTKPIQYVFDAISLPSTQKIGIDILASGGKLALVLQLAVDVPEDKTVVEILARSRVPSNIHLLEPLYHDKISGYIANGYIKPLTFEVLPGGLAGIPGGLARMEADAVSGLKLVGHPQETP